MYICWIKKLSIRDACIQKDDDQSTQKPSAIISKVRWKLLEIISSGVPVVRIL